MSAGAWVCVADWLSFIAGRNTADSILDFGLGILDSDPPKAEKSEAGKQKAEGRRWAKSNIKNQRAKIQIKNQNVQEILNCGLRGKLDS